MNLSDLHQRLSRDASYRKAYAELGDSLHLAVHFRAAREAARLTRSQLAVPLGLKPAHIAEIEDDFNFSDPVAVSLVADRLEGHLRERGVDPARFFKEGARLADVVQTKAVIKAVVWRLEDFEESSRRGDLRGEPLSRDEGVVLRRSHSGELSAREAVADLVRLGVVQPRAEWLVSLANESEG